MKPTDKQITEEIAKIVWDAMAWAAQAGPGPDGTIPDWAENGNSLGQDEARRAADRIAALSAQDGAVGVKALEWKGPFAGFWEADTLGGVIKIMWDHHPGERYILNPGTDRRQSYETLEAAKAAAQADHETRIRAALTSPSPAQRDGNVRFGKCHCVGDSGPDPDCGKCAGSGTYGAAQEAGAEPVVIRAVKEYLAEMDGECRHERLDEILSSIRTALASPPLDRGDEWEPIETAPKDGTRILGWCDGEVYDLAWGEYHRHRDAGEPPYFGWQPHDFEADQTDEKFPTHWMRIPPFRDGDRSKLRENIAVCLRDEAAKFESPVDLYVEPEAARRYDREHGLYAHNDVSGVDWALESWKILADAALRAAAKGDGQ